MFLLRRVGYAVLLAVYVGVYLRVSLSIPQTSRVLSSFADCVLTGAALEEATGDPGHEGTW